MPGAPSTCAKSQRRGIRSHWDTLRRLTREKLHQHGAFGGHRSPAGSLDTRDFSLFRVRRGSYPPNQPLFHSSAARPYPPLPPCCKPMRSCQTYWGRSQCRICCTNPPWEQSWNRSAPSVFSSVVIDNIVEELDSGNEDESAGESADASSSIPTARRWTLSPPCLTVPYYSNVDDYLQPGMRPRLRSPRVHTAPPSPMRPHRVVTLPPVEIARQESLDELRTTVQLAANSMESSTKDIKLLGEKMAAATERMSDTVDGNSQALVLLTQVVDQLQMLLVATRTDINLPKPAASEQESLAKKGQTPKNREQCPSLSHQSRCSFPSLHSYSSSISLNNSMDAPSTSQGTGRLSVSCHGSPRMTEKKKNVPSAQQKIVHASLLTNGLPFEPNETSYSSEGHHSNKRRKKRRKKAT